MAPDMQLNIQGRAELLPPKSGETLPEYDGKAVNQIVCEGVVVDPPERRAEHSTAGAAVT